MQLFEQGNVTTDLPVLVNSRALLCANSGGGKSYAVRKLLEEAGSQVMSIVLDVEGEFKTLREKFDFLLIGHAGDLPVNMKAAPLLPRKLLELNLSTIIDISDLKLPQRIQYVKAFLGALMELPREFWKPCLVVVDEAHMYCGQQEKQESCHAVIDLMTRGRKRGFCGVLATQRIAKLHKDAAAEANNYMVGRTGLDVDMKRAAEILGFTSREDMLSLRNLDAGEFYVFGPAVSRHVQKVRVGRVRTTHPEVGMDLRNKATPPTQRVKDMLARLGDLPKEAEEQARTMEDLRRQIRELERQVRVVPSQINLKQLGAAEQRGYARAQQEQRPLVAQVQTLQKRLEQIAKLAQVNPVEAVAPQVQRTLVVPRPVNPPRRAAPALAGDSTLGRCERSILSLLWNNPQRQFKKTIVGVFTGYSHKSGGFNNAVCKLNAAGLIRRVGDCLQVSEGGVSQGEEVLGADVNLHEEFTVENWAQKLPKCESMIFQFLLGRPDEALTKEELGEATGYQPGSGGFNNAICRLNSLGLIVRTPGHIQINPEVLDAR